jgi:hypothetical protein
LKLARTAARAEAEDGIKEALLKQELACCFLGFIAGRCRLKYICA